jgi:hypothetical protein
MLRQRFNRDIILITPPSSTQSAQPYQNLRSTKRSTSTPRRREQRRLLLGGDECIGAYQQVPIGHQNPAFAFSGLGPRFQPGDHLLSCFRLENSSITLYLIIFLCVSRFICVVSNRRH